MTHIILHYLLLGSVRSMVITSDQLMDAIAEVESHRGATSANVYQLTPIYVEDVCRITGQRITFEQATGSDELARACIHAYWDHYGHWYYRITSLEADAEVLARMHNGGPDGWRKESTRPYWVKVRAALVTRAHQMGGAR